MTEFKVPGASVAFIQHGEMIWNKAFGVRNTTTNEPVDTDTLFEAASVSKTVFCLRCDETRGDECDLAGSAIE